MGDLRHIAANGTEPVERLQRFAHQQHRRAAGQPVEPLQVLDLLQRDLAVFEAQTSRIMAPSSYI